VRYRIQVGRPCQVIRTRMKWRPESRPVAALTDRSQINESMKPHPLGGIYSTAIPHASASGIVVVRPAV
jgi:hypothetical protein